MEKRIYDFKHYYLEMEQYLVMRGNYRLNLVQALYSPVMASNFETSSQRKYKTNIRDVQFSALEKLWR